MIRDNLNHSFPSSMDFPFVCAYSILFAIEPIKILIYETLFQTQSIPTL